MADEPPTIEAFLAENERKELLRFSTAGSIDDGKSTLIGRLLHDSKNVYADHLAAVKDVSREKASVEQIDFALLTDGLKAEREQGITIDVAYRYFSTPKRKYIIADTPGHEQYTRNMATGASTANLAVVLIDARNGVLPQTRRHAFISALLGVPHMIVAINKMDIVDYARDVYERIRDDFQAFAAKLQIPDLRFVPVSALCGDNVVNHSERMPWYTGESLLELLDSVYIGSDNNLIDLRFPVQYVLRPHLDFRGYCGQVVSGVIRKGDEVMALPSMKTSRVRSIETFDGEVDEAFPPMSVTVTLEDERDISRGDMLVHPHNQPDNDRHFEAMVVWMGEHPMDPNRPYVVKQTTQTANVRIDTVRYRIDVNTLHHEAADALNLNEIGRVVMTSLRPLFTDPYRKNRGTGSFILIDPISNNTVAAGMMIDREPADRLPSSMRAMTDSPTPLHHRQSRITAEARRARFGQEPVTIWLTGLVGSGRSEIAYALEQRLFDMGAVAMVLDGMNVRLGLSRELDFTATDRAEHLRRVAELARLANEAGILTICSFVSPNRDIRGQVADVIGKDRFVEIHVAAELAWCETRDDTGLYEQARQGAVRNVAGIHIPYEAPEDPALEVNVQDTGVDAAVDAILALLREKGLFPVRH